MTAVSVPVAITVIPRRATGHERNRNSLLAVLPASELALLAPSIREVSLSRGMVLHEPGDPIEHVYFPHDAVISLVTIMRDGGCVETATIGHHMGLDLAVGLGAPLATARAVVQLSGSAGRVGAAEFKAAALESPILREVAAGCNDLLIAQLQQSVACNALHGAEARLCRWLLDYSDHASDQLPLTQEFLAQAIGVRRTTITIMAQLLQKAGAIRYRRGIIQILDRPALERSSCECYQTVRQRARELCSRSWGAEKSAFG